MSDEKEQLDTESDLLIERFTDETRSKEDRYAAATSLFQKHKSFVLNRIKFRLSDVDMDTVYDISQEVWISLLAVKKLSRYERRGKFRGYLHRSVDFKVGEWRKRRYNRVAHDEYSDEVETETSQQPETQIEHYENHENVTTLRSILGRISDSLRVVALLECYRYIFNNEPKIEEIADVIGTDVEETAVILSNCNDKTDVSELCDREKAVWISVNYESIVVGGAGAWSSHAEFLGISAGSYRTRLTRARNYIRESLPS